MRVSVGMLCAARFPADTLWYRAEVVELCGGGLVRVRYVDYGNEEVISVWTIKKLLDHFLIVPMQALHCSMADIAPLRSDQWDDRVRPLYAPHF